MTTTVGSGAWPHPPPVDPDERLRQMALAILQTMLARMPEPQPRESDCYGRPTILEDMERRAQERREAEDEAIARSIDLAKRFRNALRDSIEAEALGAADAG